jgi:integrase
MPEKFNFTQAKISNLPIPGSGRLDYYDTDKTRLTCRVSATGVKSFVVLKWNGKSAQRITIGRFPDVTISEARKQHDKILSDLVTGVNPTEEKRKKRHRRLTLQELLDRYLSDKFDLREASIKDYRQQLKTGFSDWLDKPINSISREMVLARRKQFTGARDNKMRVLRLLMRYAVVTLKALDENPVDVIRDGGLWARPKRKTRMIASDNLKDWYQAVLKLNNEKAKVYLLLLLHTGLRDQDIRYLEWQDIDFKNSSFIARDTKNHKDFTTYIAPQIEPYLKNLQSITGQGRFLFPGATKDGVMDIPRKPIAQVCKETSIVFSSHDLKRTFLTIGEATMVPFPLLKALANHKTDLDVTGGYINAEAKTRRAATYKIADYIQAHIT